ncbi:hypothetical protein ACFVT1_31515 [Streptomyces sp. NPDC057963]|uniref:hypothetical protein n=1 Tax=Streptomyces sp. NPDC057963 TaxID=3346290 RepID=UPI0036E3E889
MWWKQEFEKTGLILHGIGAQLQHEASGLPALHQQGHKTLETVQAGTTGLREENQELRRRQERMLTDLADTRADIGALRLELSQGLQSLLMALPAEQPAPEAGEPPAMGGDEQQPESRTRPSASDSPEGELMNQNAANGPDRTGGTGRVEGDRSGALDGAALKAASEEAYQGTATTRPPLPTIPQQGRQQEEATTPAPSPEVLHGARLMKAAGVALAELICHRDTWEYLTGLSSNQTHFRTPPSVDDVKDGRVQAALSGRSLIALLIALWQTRDQADPLTADWALAATAYSRIATELDTITPGTGQRTVRIVLDDGIHAAESAAQKGTETVG